MSVAFADRSGQRWLAFGGLTLACLVAHAAVLESMRWWRASAPQQPPGVAAAAPMHVRTLAVEAMPIATARQSPAAVPSTAPARRLATVRAAIETRQSSELPLPDRDEPGSLPIIADASTLSLVPDGNAAGHWPTKLLEVPPMPRSAPDEQLLVGFHRSGLPIQVRLFVAADGTVSATELLGSAPGDEDTASQVMAMFRGTAFSPGRQHGTDVPSFIDIEVILEPLLPSLGRLIRQ